MEGKYTGSTVRYVESLVLGEGLATRIYGRTGIGKATCATSEGSFTEETDLATEARKLSIFRLTHPGSDPGLIQPLKQQK